MSETMTLVSPIITPADLPAPHTTTEPYRIVMVCTGNICRSAMAEVVLIDRLTAAGVPTDGADGVLVTSAGVSDEELGNPVDRRARRVLANHGYGVGASPADRACAGAIATHHAHRLSDRELADADLLLAMTCGHHREMTRRAERLGLDASRIRMFRELDPHALAQRQELAEGAGARYSLDVPDPWYGTVEDFVETLEVVERVSDALTPALVELAAGSSPDGR
ncbi:low molecular weight protein-tyrosine-phosphatase [Actinomyces urogenitalis]|uniref:low molecular weight protein-tyrosine-phosphatase n=1 Tax=Actinomyces urogenitalis TaxID=103621 RepID=UPI00066136D2|nr:low molecular weight protein-tyrosine-phosphatase [Actinomyces urogenitalis]MBS6071704.1 low molecular weight phosphotyrosine protein phosphatase [Actinomyces urogenitalis]MDK8238486.1 low molecular weight protein-tyrosine-phosphatase [Actinomyces urogenitalis]MDU5426919.1 low molecular weight protein-tyrosine-phosphatase [Actinomyces urogenitalis]MDU7428759.1 low molecular weight protein-tyrosine-phosphatase [Actinomyces urogenitalis]WOO95652.1 low molecular weight protein-tyrosine-phospha